MKKSIKPLKLTAETVRLLTHDRLRDLAGGAASQTCSNNSCDPLHGTCRTK